MAWNRMPPSSRFAFMAECVSFWNWKPEQFAFSVALKKQLPLPSALRYFGDCGAQTAAGTRVTSASACERATRSGTNGSRWKPMANDQCGRSKDVRGKINPLTINGKGVQGGVKNQARSFHHLDDASTASRYRGRLYRSPNDSASAGAAMIEDGIAINRCTVRETALAPRFQSRCE